MIVIVDYGMGNLRSVLKRIERMGYNANLSSGPDDIEMAKKLILPGVGAFGTGMENLSRLGLLSVLNWKVLENKTPVLGICLGMQLLSRKSEEGDVEGLGWIDAETIRFRFSGMEKQLRIPHMGWNTIKKKENHFLLRGIEENASFYFVHSFHVKCDDPSVIMATTEYGYDFPSIIYKEHIIGTQFHPEKSHQSGVNLLRAFLEI
jgi:imidazole glycerol-phosphate synthase subunit HisH